MKIRPKGNLRRFFSSGRYLSVAFLLVLLLGVILGLANNVRLRLSTLERATSDNGQWVMMQCEVEVLRLQYALVSVQAGQLGPDDVRRWFDVLYSRLRLIEESPIYNRLTDIPENRIRLEQMRSLVDGWVEVMDGPDRGIIAALPLLQQETAEVQKLSRSLSLSTLQNFSASSDKRREEFANTLVRLALSTLATFAVLVVMLVMLARLYALTRRQSEDNMITGARLQTIIATSPDAIIVTNRGGWTVEFNPAAERMFGVSRSKVLGKQVVPMIFSPKNVAAYQQKLNEAIAEAATQGPQRFELDGLRGNGQVFPLELSIAIRDLSRGSLIVAFLRDVSARRASSLALQQALTKARAGEKAKAEFLAVMSHEMRTPLNGLIGAMDLMHDTALSPDQAELLRVMDLSGDILLGHVNSVLDISRYEAGELRLANKPFDLDSLVQECIANQSGIAKANGTDLFYSQLSGSSGKVRGDPERLRQILLNLIGNAVKFTKNGSITVETERLTQRSAEGAQDIVEFRVADTGIGIAPEDQDRIFKDFETLDVTYDRNNTGTGLGLGIARRLVNAMQGSIGVESDLGEGSVFWVRLPLPICESGIPFDLAGASGKTARKGGKPAPPTSLKILIVEDNEVNRFLLRRYLTTAGHHVVEAFDGVEGVAAAQSEAFDVIFTDISMPRMDGVEATRAIRAGGGPSAKARIVALTAHALPEELTRFKAAGIDACFTKPVTREVLMNSLKDGNQAAPLPQQDNDALAPVVDQGPLSDLSGELGADLVVHLLGRMILDGDSTMIQLSEHTRPDGEVAKIVHQLAGSCATFGAMRLREKLAAIEVAIKQGEPDRAVQDLADLPALWAETRVALELHVKEMVA
jgi:PAS domain S-box-containing protein